MGTARDTVVEQLAALPADLCRVRPYARLNRQPAEPTLLVRVDEIEPVEQYRLYRFSLIVLSTKLVTDDDAVGGVDDEIDDLVELVLAELDKGITNLLWKSAKRGVYEPTNSPCYIIAAELVGDFPNETEVTP
jgi:hypothetical protein